MDSRAKREVDFLFQHQRDARGLVTYLYMSLTQLYIQSTKSLRS